MCRETLVTMKMMKKMTNDCRSVPGAARLGNFLARYSGLLLGCGATCIRLEKNVDRIAHACGAGVETMVMPRHVQLSVMAASSFESHSYTASAAPVGISYAVNAALSRLSWEIADGKVTFDQAEEILGRISENGGGVSRGVTLLLVGVANASFCRLFGGDAAAMAVVAVATVAGFFVRGELMRRRVDMRLTVAVCSFVSAVLGATAMLFGFGDTPSVALGTSVLYLVPGIPFLNSFSDMVYRHYVCAFGRFMDAVVLTCCLSAGLCAAMLLMNAGMF